MRFTRLILTAIVLLQLALASQAAQPKVGVIYFVPSDRTAQADINTKIDTLVKAAQTSYTNKVGKTFAFETDTDGTTVKVNQITGEQNDSYYLTADLWQVWWGEITNAGFDPSQNIYITFWDFSSGDVQGWCGTGGDYLDGGLGGVVNMAVDSDCFDGTHGTAILVHELGHAFGLRHDYRNHPDYDIDLVTNDPMVTSTCATTWLSSHPYFNNYSTSPTGTTTIDMSDPAISGSSVSVTFTISDTDGLHQAHFFETITESYGFDDLSLLDCASLSGTSTTATFTTSATDSVSIRVMDSLGRTTEREFTVDLSAQSTTLTDGDTSGDTHKVSTISIQDLGELTLNRREQRTNPADVNADGIVNVQDLVQVASNLGQTGQNIADINEDGVVNITDLILVAGALSEDAAAPSLWHPDLEFTPTGADVHHWLREARQANLTDPTVQRGILMLKQLLASLTPKETALLPNYPNPFNPETWIPYHLVKPADVSISIYAADGKLVRSLELGHQSIGIYQNKSRAAYWDGKNELGEPVASGVYFYTLTADDFSATRKMLIRK